MPLSQPLSSTRKAYIAPQTAATTADTAVEVAPFPGTVTSVTFVPNAAITGATATKRTFTLENRGAAGAGTTVIATLDLITGVNPAKHVETAFTLSGTPANLAFVAGDVLAVKEAVTSTGTANPGGIVNITQSRGEVGA